MYQRTARVLLLGMAPNRIVALATPLAAPLAGAFAAWLSQRAGIELPREAIEETFLAVTGLVLALALQFNHNRFKWDVEERRATEPPVDDSEPFEIDDDDLDDDEELLDEEELLDDEEPLDDEDDPAVAPAIR